MDKLKILSIPNKRKGIIERPNQGVKEFQLKIQRSKKSIKLNKILVEIARKLEEIEANDIRKIYLVKE